MTGMMERLDRWPLAAIMGGLLGAAAAFAAWAMPIALVERLVWSSGLPDLLAAAEPPLGQTARAALVLTAGVAGTLAGWLVMRLFDAPAAKSAAPEAPSLRRSDAHPDAPARRPIFAAEEFGRPCDADETSVLTGGTDELLLTDVLAPPAAEMAAPELAGDTVADATAPWVSAPPRRAQRRWSRTGNESIGELIARLEAGLADRQRPGGVTAEAWLRRPNRPGPAIREAIGELQRLVARRA